MLPRSGAGAACAPVRSSRGSGRHHGPRATQIWRARGVAPRRPRAPRRHAPLALGGAHVRARESSRRHGRRRLGRCASPAALALALGSLASRVAGRGVARACTEGQRRTHATAEEFILLASASFPGGVPTPWQRKRGPHNHPALGPRALPRAHGIGNLPVGLDSHRNDAAAPLELVKESTKVSRQDTGVHLATTDQVAVF